MIRINNIKIRKNLNNPEVFNLVLKTNHINSSDVISWRISRKSIDARKKDDVHFNYSIDIDVKNEHKYKKFEKIKKFQMPNIAINNKSSLNPIIIGARTCSDFLLQLL